MLKLKALLFNIFIFTLIALLSACGNSQRDDSHFDRNKVRESLLGANTLLIDAEDQEIRDFIDRHGWEMHETGSGLRYMIYEQGWGPKARTNDIVSFHYTISLITGDLVYNSHDSQPGEFRLGRGGVESGLEEGMLLLRVGDRARFIMPSHLAHGVPGDGVKIPKRATIIYDIQLIELK